MENFKIFNKNGGNVAYKALSHPLSVATIINIIHKIKGNKIAFYDPDSLLSAFYFLYPSVFHKDFLSSYFYLTHHSEDVGQLSPFGSPKIALIDFPKLLKEKTIDSLFILSFDDFKIKERLKSLVTKTINIISLSEACLPQKFIPFNRKYLDNRNFVTNFAFFRDNHEFSTRLTTANYWSDYSKHNLIYWFQLFDNNGHILAQWEETISYPSQSIIIDSSDIKQKFSLPDFTGQLFIHIIGADGHDVLKYALDIFGKNENNSLSVTHDANSWPSRRYASLPAPYQDETIILWIQNSHGTTIHPSDISLAPMGKEKEKKPLNIVIPPYATVPIDVKQILPTIEWPNQLELFSNFHIVRPRYEVTRGHKTRIAHLNIERDDLNPDPDILSTISSSLGRGIILPFPLPDPQKYDIWLQPNPMSERAREFPLRLDFFTHDGAFIKNSYLGVIQRDDCHGIYLNNFISEEGHVDITYDFRNGGVADGWLHAMMRYRNKENGYCAETSFGGHIFNTIMTWRNEPQSYNGPAPGLSTKIFLKLGLMKNTIFIPSFCWLIYPSSLLKNSQKSQTILYLYNSHGKIISKAEMILHPSGSKFFLSTDIFSSTDLQKAGEGGYIIIRDYTCRLFGYHGLKRDDGAFSLDHMFGF